MQELYSTSPGCSADLKHLIAIGEASDPCAPMRAAHYAGLRVPYERHLQ